jgi:L-malate glycosyltransferase
VKRILFYESRPEWGGAQKCELDLLISLESESIETYFLSSTDGPMISRIKEAGKEPTIIPINDSVNRIRKGQVQSGRLFLIKQLLCMLPHLVGVIFFILRNRIDIVYTSQFRSQLVIGWIGKLLGRKVIWHIHGEEQLDNLLGKVSVMAADQIVVVADSLSKRYRALYPQKEFIVVHNGVEVRSSAPQKNNDTFTISMVGTLIEGKRQDLAIAACTELIDMGYNIQLNIIGEKPPWHSANFKNFLHELAADITSSVSFLGWIENPFDYLRQSDVLILPSDTEGLPLSIIEAMALGLPAISTNVGGVPELIEDGETGFIINQGSIDELVEKLIFLLEHPSVRERMGAQARKRYETYFTKESFVKGVEGVINTTA